MLFLVRHHSSHERNGGTHHRDRKNEGDQAGLRGGDRRGLAHILDEVPGLLGEQGFEFASSGGVRVVGLRWLAASERDQQIGDLALLAPKGEKMINISSYVSYVANKE